MAYQLPRGTLHHRLQPHRLAYVDQLRISESQGDDLVRWILRQEGLGYAPSHAQVRAIVVSLLNRQGDTDPLGKKWSTHFIKRHPEIKTKLGRRTD